MWLQTEQQEFEKMTFEQRLEGMEEISLVVNLGKSSSDTGSDQCNYSKARASPVCPQEPQETMCGR